MALTTLTCPHCGLSKELEESVLPAAGSTVKCPRCQGRFPLRIGGEAAPAPEALSGAPASSTPLSQGAHTPPPLPPPLPPRSEAPPFRSLALTFTGNGKEYFGVWIVNTLLRIVTLGIYSPWAKVRKRRYFYGNTLLDDAPFDYLADPVAILKGWLIAGLCLLIYSLASRVYPVAASVMGLLFWAIYPWIMVRARIFSMRNSSHRNIRFSFKPNYRDAYKVYLGWPLLVPFTLGLLAPYVIYRQRRFVAENSSYGTTAFEFEATAKQYYRLFLPVLIVIAVALVTLPLLPFAVKAAGATVALAKNGGKNVLLALVPLAGLVTVYLLVALYIPTAITNLTWKSTRIAGHSFDSTLRVRDLAWIHFSNAVAVVCSLGLLTPWATVRLARYRLDKLAVSGAGAFDNIIASAEQSMGAASEEFGDIFGLEIGL